MVRIGWRPRGRRGWPRREAGPLRKTAEVLASGAVGMLLVAGIIVLFHSGSSPTNGTGRLPDGGPTYGSGDTNGGTLLPAPYGAVAGGLGDGGPGGEQTGAAQVGSPAVATATVPSTTNPANASTAPGGPSSGSSSSGAPSPSSTDGLLGGVVGGVGAVVGGVTGAVGSLVGGLLGGGSTPQN